MTRKDLIHLLVLQARANGFELRKWYQSTVDRHWTTAQAAVANLATGRRYYALLFSHEFAESFWKQGTQMQFVVPTQQFLRLNAKGQRITVTRKAYTRRTLKPDAWKYHLREMAACEEPLRYIRRFLVTHEELHAQRRSSPRPAATDPDELESGI